MATRRLDHRDGCGWPFCGRVFLDVVLSLFGMAPAVAAAFMSLTTIIVAVNAQLLRRVDLSA